MPSPRKVKKSIILHGRRKPRRVQKIKYAGFLGEGVEGRVNHIKAVLRKGKRQKVIDLVEKSFWEDKKGIQDPLTQFKIMKELDKLNKEKNLGLKIPATIRLRKVKGKKPRLIMTKLPLVKYTELNGIQFFRYFEDIINQIEKAKKIGFELGIDSFKAALDKRGFVSALICDFGAIKRMPKKA